MDYEITRVSDKIIFIKRHCDPCEPAVEEQFLADLEQALDEAGHPVYVISDLRAGRIKEVETLRKLGELVVEHPNFAGSTAFTGDIYTPLFVRIFSRFARQLRPSNEVWANPNDALAYLESLELGVTEGIDWEALLNG